MCSLLLQKKITLLDEEYGRIVYSMLENNNQSIFFNLSSCKPEHNIMENCSTFFNQISRHFLFLFSQSSSLLLHSYVCETPRPITHPHTRCPGKKESRRQSTSRWHNIKQVNSLFATTTLWCTCVAGQLRRSFAASLPRRAIAN